MSGPHVFIDGEANEIHRHRGIQLWRQCDIQRRRSGAPIFQQQRVVDGVTIVARATANAAGNRVQIYGGAVSLIYLGQYDFASPNHRMFGSVYDFDTNAVDTATEVVAYENTSLPNSSSVFFKNADMRVSEGSGYCIFVLSGGAQRIDMYKDNVLLATKTQAQLVTDAGGTSGGAIQFTPGMLDDGRFGITTFYTSPGFTIITSLYDRAGVYVGTYATPEVGVCLHSRAGGSDIFLAAGEDSPNETYRTKISIFDSAYTYVREISMRTKIGMTAGSGLIQAMFQRGTNLYILSHSPYSSPSTGTQYFGVLDLTTDTYTNINTRSSLQPKYGVSYDGYMAESVYVDEAEENAYYVWMLDRTFTIDTKRVHLQKTGGTWGFVAEVNLASDPDLRGGIYTQ